MMDLKFLFSLAAQYQDAQLDLDLQQEKIHQNNALKYYKGPNGIIIHVTTNVAYNISLFSYLEWSQSIL